MLTTLAFLSPGPWQVIMVLIVVLVLFGNRLPSVMRSLGIGITEFKKGIREGDTAADKLEEGGTVNAERSEREKETVEK